MRIVILGGGPAGLYFGLLMKAADPRHAITIYERNRPDDTFGFGVVFSDATLGNLAAADPDSYAQIARRFAHWDDIDIHVRGEVIRSVGHGFCGLDRAELLSVLQARCEQLGVELVFETEISAVDAIPGADRADLVVAADGLSSAIRDSRPRAFRPDIDVRPNKFVWLGTTFPFAAFTFYFKENEHGLWRVHAYRYKTEGSTFIVECTDETWRRAGLDRAGEEDTIAYLEGVFADELAGHPLIKNRSIWRNFPTVRNGCWHSGNIVLVGDAAHTAHFSIGSGTKLAMEDAIALRDALAGEEDVPVALARYERERRPAVESLQRAAQVSLEWFENTESLMRLEPIQFAFSLLTRSLRVTHENLARRDPALARRVDAWVSARAHAAAATPAPEEDPPPMFTPLEVRGVTLANRVVAGPSRQGRARDGVVGDLQLVHLGACALGGAALVMAELCAVSEEGRIDAGTPGLYEDRHVAGWGRVADFVHGHTDARLGVQLGHAGRRAHGGETLAPSPLSYEPGTPPPHAMNAENMARIVDAFAAAAARGGEAGFDWLEIDMSGGFLLGTFLSPLSNHRDDEYGGDLAARARFPLEVLAAVRAAWPEERPLCVRIPGSDYAPGGLEPGDAVALAGMLAGRGCDVVAVSGGGIVPGARPPEGRLAEAPICDQVRNGAGVTAMVGGGIASYTDINSLVAAGRADLCALGRAHLFDPFVVRHAAYAQGRDPGWPPGYARARSFTPHW